MIPMLTHVASYRRMCSSVRVKYVGRSSRYPCCGDKEPFRGSRFHLFALGGRDDCGKGWHSLDSWECPRGWRHWLHVCGRVLELCPHEAAERRSGGNQRDSYKPSLVAGAYFGGTHRTHIYARYRTSALAVVATD